MRSVSVLRIFATDGPPVPGWPDVCGQPSDAGRGSARLGGVPDETVSDEPGLVRASADESRFGGEARSAGAGLGPG